MNKCFNYKFLMDLKRKLKKYPLLFLIAHYFRYLLTSSYRIKYKLMLKKISEYRKLSGNLLHEKLGNGSKGVVVICGWSQFEHILAESLIRKAFELADYNVHVLTEVTKTNRVLYSSLGVSDLDHFLKYCPLPNLQLARSMIDSVLTFNDLINLKYCDVAVGKYLVSTFLRKTRRGHIEIFDKAIRELLIVQLAESMAYVVGAEKMISKHSPKVQVMVDKGYSPYGEIFDVCINKKIPIYTWNAAHRDNTIMLKRYDASNRDVHPSSLSLESWSKLLNMEWDIEKREIIRQELYESYGNCEWYGEVGTQHGKKIFQKNEIIKKLNLNPNKKTAVIFSHIFWDATFFWGVDLFRDYEDWFVQTIKVAIKNDNLNWIIKVHPANLIKDKRDGVNGYHSEIIAIQKHIGILPPHVKVMSADTDISTLSLFEITDYCLTVRGTVGIEAAFWGKNVLTAGTGRYDRLGFTKDFDTREDYLKQLEALEGLEAPNFEMRKLAERFCYGTFMCRPTKLKTFEFKFSKDGDSMLQTGWKVKNISELSSAKELIAIANWLGSGQEDFFTFNE